MAETHLKLDLVNNGIDFIRAGIETFFKSDEAEPRDHKYAIMHMFSGTLLILKARLAQEHESLIWEKLDNQQGANTVNFAELIKRLRICAKVIFSAADTALLERAQKLRNELEHYVCEIELKNTQVIIGDLATFAFGFLGKELAVELNRHLDHDVWRRLQAIAEIADEFHRRLLKEWNDEVAKVTSLSAEELLEIRNESRAAGQLYYCNECHVPSYKMEFPEPSVVSILNNLGYCTNDTCRTIYGPDRCNGCGELLNNKHDKTIDTGLCWSCMLSEKAWPALDTEK